MLAMCRAMMTLGAFFFFFKNNRLLLNSALKKDVWVDGKCIGETALNIFFYEEVAGDKTHTNKVRNPNNCSNNAINKLYYDFDCKHFCFDI
jgi:hypothetical protein